MKNPHIKSSTYLSMNVLIHVIILFSFLSMFFFAFVSKVEEKAFKNELGDMIEENLNKVIMNNQEVKPYLHDISPSLKKINVLYQDDDRFTLERNILVKFSAIFTVLVLLSIFITIVATLAFGCDRKVSLKHLIIENIIIFILIGMVEYMFFTRIAIKFVPTTPSLMVNTLINTLKTQFKK